MKDFYECIVDIAEALPPDCVRSAARKLQDGVSCNDAVSLWGTQLAQSSLIASLKEKVENSGLSAKEISVALFGAVSVAESYRKNNIVDILWTGPKTSSVPVRRMEQALCELIDSASRTLFIVSFVAYKADKVYAAIENAMARGVRVSFLTEASKEHGGSLDVDPTDQLRKKFPHADFYRWENQGAGIPAVVHVKCAIADENKVLVTSANLTGAAMDNNMELGLMISGSNVARRVAAHFAALITERVLRKI